MTEYNLRNERKVGVKNNLDLYHDAVTDAIYRKLKEVDSDGISFPRYEAYRLDHDGEMLGYVIVDDKDEPVLSFEETGLASAFETIDFKMMMLRMNTKDMLDIREIAKTGNIFRQ